MMAERERHRDAKLFGPHRDSRQPRTEEIAIFLNERHDVADFLEFLVDPAFLISGRIGREFVMLAARVDRLERGLGGHHRGLHRGVRSLDPRHVDDNRRAPDQRAARTPQLGHRLPRSEEHTSELQSLMSISYADSWLKKTKI